ncbi:YbjP/YqhG family protein [Citrobacter freundii]|uniref:YbjP/YqhG family protein n=1 Tax=Citrobacter freundii TaxID=546 RepID=UPI00193B8D9F|nr:YbjP/YqhG family protein [Citrobacter freundii]MBM3010022.1 YbjP/YqhG family protein [Citrobacter freundii]MCT1465819.1 YbjP/YqhG family protein [Citrobacter freundii]MCT1493986.1 YbjP/YqhG family protein [Citrobacter freundii]
MRFLYVVLMLLAITACNSGRDNAEQRVSDFYAYYLNVFANSEGKIKPAPEKMNDYISKDTLTQLNVISNIYEQEIIDTDYYTYAQDYSANWIPLLKVGKAKNSFGGKYVDVWLGRQNNQTYQIGVYLKMEGGQWKIYRVKNVTAGYEHYIFDEQAIARARQHAADIN